MQRRSGQGEENASPAVREVVRILEDARYDFPDLRQLGAMVGLSPSYLHRKFRREIGQTIGDYLRDNQMQLAAFRLQTTDDPVSALYADYGYGSQAAFTRAFTARFGEPPDSFRRSRREQPAPPPAPVHVRRFAPLRCWARRYVGGGLGDATRWADFLARLGPHAAGGEALVGLMLDDPRVRAQEEVRFDCCIAFRDPPPLPEALAADGFELFETTAGQYAVVEHEGGYGAVGRAYGALVAAWLPHQSRWVLAGGPILEVVRQPAPDFASAALKVEVCLRVRPANSAPDWTAGRDQRLRSKGLPSPDG